jgi:carboxyl-terminal processing protease
LSPFTRPTLAGLTKAMIPADPELPDPIDVDPPQPTATEPVAARPARRLPVLPIAIALVAILAGGALFMSGYSLGAKASSQPGTPVSETEAFQPFWDAYHSIDQRYAGGDIDRNALVEGAIKGMIDSLGDPYSSYLTSEEYRNTLQGINGQFEGIGAEIASQAPDGTQGCTTLGPDCHLVVVSPIDGSPAQAAGLKPGDLVLATDGVSLNGLTVDAARAKIRGPKGSIVTLTVQRGTAAAFDVKITRDIIQQKEVDSKVLAAGTIGYVRMAGFSDTAAQGVRDALKAHVDAGRTKLILDLRGNPGGFVTAARSVASDFIADGVIFWEQDAQGAQTSTSAAPGGVATSPNLTVVVLIDGGSASASEIVAGALQDTKRATLIGQQSFGKGTVQQWQELGDGSAFKLTIARWLTPNKRWIHKVGLTPDVVVTIPAGAPADQDLTLDKAIQVLGGSGAVAWLAAA